MKKIAPFLLCLLWGLNLFGQSAECNELLRTLLPDGVYEYDRSDVTEDVYHSVLFWYKTHKEDSYTTIKNKSASLTVPIDDILVGLGLSANEEGYQHFVHDIESYYNSYSTFHQSIHREWSHIDTQAINAVNGCFIKQPGLRALKITKGDSRSMIIRFFYNNDYRGAPATARVTVSQQTPNIVLTNKSVKSIRVKNNDHQDLLIQRTDDNPALIILRTDARTESGSSLSFDMGPAVVTTNKKTLTYIENGFITENPANASTYYPIPAMSAQEAAFHHSPIPLPTPPDLGPEYSTAALGRVSWSKTLTSIDTSRDAESYHWTLTLKNILGARCGPDAKTADAALTPFYTTKVHLADPSSRSFWRLRLRLGTNALEGGMGAGDSCTVTLSGKGKFFKVKYRITTNHPQLIDSLFDQLPGGIYDLELVMPTIGRSCGGGLPDGNRVESIFITTLHVEADKIPEASTPPVLTQPSPTAAKSFVWLIAAGVSITVIIIFLLVRTKKR